jgi:hypothetical protein
MIGAPGFITVETVMFFGLGFLLAALLMLAFMPAVHDRAVRLTRRKYDPVPLSEKEMHTAKDRLRADFAMSTRKLENDIDQMQRKAAEHFSELARKSETIAQLKETLDTRDTLIAQLQSQKAELAAGSQKTGAEWLALKAENAGKAKALQEANERIAALMAEIKTLTAALDRRIHVFDAQQHEIMMLTGQSDALRAQLEALENAKEIKIYPTPAFVPAASQKDRRPETNGDGDGEVIRRALEAIDADARGNGHAGWMTPSNGAIPFGH